MAYNSNNGTGAEKGQKNKSKYLRDPNEKRTSKYVRDKNEKPKSKYIKDSFEVKEHHYNLTRNYRWEEENEEAEEAAVTEEAENENAESVSEQTESDSNAVNEENTSVEGAETEESVEELNDSADEEAETDKQEDESVIIEPFEDIDETESQPKGDISAIFKHSKMSRETTVAQVKNAEESRRKILIKTVIVMIVLTAASCALVLGRIQNIPYTPVILNFDLSIIPEFIASLAYGPVFGFIIIVVKAVFMILTKGALSTSFGTIFSNFVLDTIFVFVSGGIYTRKMFNVNPKKNRKPNRKDKRKDRIFLSGAAASIVTTFVSVFLTRYVSYPFIIREYSGRVNDYYLMSVYQSALDSLNTALPEYFSSTVTKFDSLMQGIVFYNVPLTLFKLMIATIAVVIIYPAISPYIHFRKISK